MKLDFRGQSNTGLLAIRAATGGTPQKTTRRISLKEPVVFPVL